ncbi:MAG: 50S ribosomal protein L5 [Patescibacteria group bacterium]
MLNLKEQYNKETITAMQKKFGYKNKMAVPRIEKVNINVGISANKKDEKYQNLVEQTLTRISGQKPVFTKARLSVSSFKIREGNIVGAKVTLRGKKMYDFVEKLIHVTLPRIRDFRGISPKSVDRDGNLTIGFKEHLAFPEVDSGELELFHGLEISITTTAKNRERGLELFNLIGMPFKKSS